MSVNHETSAASEMYDILAGKATLYIDEYGLIWSKYDHKDREFTRKLTPEEFIRSAQDVDVEKNRYDKVTTLKMTVQSPTYDADVIIDFLENTITTISYDAKVILSYEYLDENFPLSDTILEMDENAVLYSS